MMGLPPSRGVSVLAAFAAETAHGGVCDAVCGAAGLRAALADGVAILRPLDVRASLGGPLPLLPLIERVHAAAGGGAVDGGAAGGGAAPGPPSAPAAMLAPVVRALTALLRGEPIHKTELLRADALGMLGHALDACPCGGVDAELLAAFCGLEPALEGAPALSDQLLLRIFLRVHLWAKGGFAIMQPVLRQLCRMAADRPEQWARVEALPRLFDAMLDEFAADPPLAPAARAAADDARGGGGDGGDGDGGGRAGGRNALSGGADRRPAAMSLRVDSSSVRSSAAAGAVRAACSCPDSSSSHGLDDRFT